ncbi:SRPBCC family protein [bacterium]|nr:SRPBCC family protein [bacterium]
MSRKIKLALIIVLVVGTTLVLLNSFAEGEVHAKEEVLIEKDIEAVWEVMGSQYAQVHLWSSNFKASKPGGKPKLPGLDYLHRATQTTRGETLQELDEFDPVHHSLSYHITKGAPKIAKEASGIWSLKSMGPEKTRVVLEFHMATKGVLGLVMIPLIKKNIGKAAAQIGEELKYYMEKGKPHPRKVAS